MFNITTERAEDGPAIEALLDRAFGPDRHSKISYRYRVDVEPLPELKLAARDAQGALIGTIRYWPILVGWRARPALLLGPVAVDAAWRSAGIGAVLIRQTLAMAEWARHQRVLLVGDIAYYRRFGFAPAAPLGITMPDEDPARVQVLGLAPGALDDIAGPVQRWRSVRRRKGKLKAA